MWSSNDAAVGVLPDGLLDKSNVKVAVIDSSCDAVVVPTKTATIRVALAILDHSNFGEWYQAWQWIMTKQPCRINHTRISTFEAEDCSE